MRENINKRSGKSIFRHSLDTHSNEVETRQIKAARHLNVTTSVQRKRNIMKARVRSRQSHPRGENL